MKTLKNKIIVAVTGLVMLSGCADMPSLGQPDLSWGNVIGLAGSSVANNPNSTARQRASGAALSQYGYATANQDAVRDSRSQVNIYNNSQGTQNYYNNEDELPLVFSATGGFYIKGDSAGRLGNYTGIGKKIYHPGEKIFIIGRSPIFKMGKEVINYSICLTTGESFLPVKKKGNYLNPSDELAVFDVTGGYEYAKKKGYNTSVWVNIWEVDGKEVGRVTSIMTDEDMENPPR